MPGKNITIIDNYDSFTYNIVQYLGDLNAPCTVYRNDKVTADQVISEKPDGILISPGPSDPDHAGICLDLVEKAGRAQIPLLGVCLGHQAVGQAFGGKIARAQVPMHGKLSSIMHNGQGIFKNIPSPLTATRYHSLIVERESCPVELEITAETNEGTIMGLQHKTLPLFGVQYHPESIATETGHILLKNFTDLL